jgi:hypothetical protein
MWHAWERGEKVYKLLGGKPEGKNELEDRGVDGRMGLEWILGSGFTWLTIGTGRGLLWMR